MVTRDEEAFELNDYTKNMKAKIIIFNLKGKANIWWADVKRVRDIRTESVGINSRDFLGIYICQRGIMIVEPRNYMS